MAGRPAHGRALDYLIEYFLNMQQRKFLEPGIPAHDISSREMSEALFE
jgi:hypothetical protein